MGHSRPAAEHNLLSSASVFVCACCCWNGNRRICTELSTGVWTFKGFSIFCRSEHAIKCVCVFEGGGRESEMKQNLCQLHRYSSVSMEICVTLSGYTMVYGNM